VSNALGGLAGRVADAVASLDEDSVAPPTALGNLVLVILTKVAPPPAGRPADWRYL
jgi:hypothetical protein